MTPEESGEGTAREIPRGRLASFEDDPAGGTSLSLPPRPSRQSTASPSAPRPTKVKKDLPTEKRSTSTPTVTETAKAELRASNIHIPVALLDPLSETKRTTRMSNGDIIITAIEQTYEELKSRLQPRPVTGGALFGKRVSKPPRTPIVEPVTPLNYRLSVEDYAVLDRLVDELGASSRSHLITLALSAYYKQEPQQPPS